MKKLLLSSFVAVCCAATPAYADEWLPVSNVDNLVDGTECIIVYKDGGKAMSITQTDTYRATTDVTITNGTITELPADAAIVRVNRSGDFFTLYVTNGEAQGYLQPISDGKKTLNVKETPVDASIKISNGVASITFRNQEDKNVLDCVNMFDFSTGTSAQVFYCVDQASFELSLFSATAGDKPGVEWTFDPASDDYVETLEQFTMTFANVASVSLTENTEEPLELTATVADEPLEAPVAAIDGTTVTFTHSTPVTTAGIYTLTIPAGYFTFTLADGTTQLSEEITYDLYLEGAPVEQIFTVSPEPGEYKSYPVVTLTYENCTDMELYEDVVAYLTISDDSGDLYEEHVLDLAVDVNTVTVTPREEITAYSTTGSTYYTLWIPSMSYIMAIDGQYVDNEDVEIDNITVNPNAGVTAVFAAPGETTFDIYTPAGVCVARNASSLSGLAKGIYIVNGKKIAIR